MFYLLAFGGLALTSDLEALPASAHQRRRLTLLVQLAAAGPAGMSRDRLLGYLWPDSSMERAQHALDQLLYATRRDLGKQAVVAEGGQLRLNPEVVGSDVAAFDAHLAREEWETAAAMYSGPFLDGVHLGGGPELDQWIEVERSRREARYVQALEMLAHKATERGEVQDALSWWRRRAAAEPLSANGARGLVRALLRAGDRAGAFQYVRTYGQLVRQQLGVEADPEILALAEQWDREAVFLIEPPVEAAGSKVTPPSHDADPPTDGAWAEDRAGTPPVRPDRPHHSTAPRSTRARLAGWSGGRKWGVVLAGCSVLIILTGGLVLRRASPLPAHPVEVNSVAVLPFEDFSADGSAEYLGDGISEELIHALTQVPDLKVAARTSAFAFKERHQDIREIARTLGVSAIVEGSVRREGNRLRVTAQLIDAASGYHLWSGSFDRRMGDALAIQDEVARSVTRTLRPQLASPRLPGGASTPPNARAYHLYLQGRYAWNEGTEPSLRKAVDLFERAVTEDPSYAAAYAGLADAHDALADGGFAPAEPSYQAAETAARRAIQLDSTLAEAHAALGHLRFHRWDWTGAEQAFQRALDLNPGHAGTHGRYAMLLVMRGDFEEGLARMRRAQELDPLALSAHNRMGWLLFLARQHEEAIDQLRAVIAMDSTVASAHARLGLSLVEIGRHEEGIAALERAVELGGGYRRSALPMLGYAYAKAGRRTDAERIRARVEHALGSDSINPYYGAALMAAVGEEDRSFAWLNHAYDTNRGCLIDLGVDPMVDALRPDRRYDVLTRALGMERHRHVAR